jgi:hypothetical protein
MPALCFNTVKLYLIWQLQLVLHMVLTGETIAPNLSAAIRTAPVLTGETIAPNLATAIRTAPVLTSETIAPNLTASIRIAPGFNRVRR